MKKTFISSLLLASFFSYGEYVSIINSNSSYDIGFPIIVKNWSDWYDIGSTYDCSTFSPLVTDINHGVDFVQTKNCKQEQERTQEIYELHPTNGEVLIETKKQNKTIDVEITQNNTGSLNYIVSTGTETNEWANSGSSTCEAWTPSTSSITFGENFTQTQKCSQEQIKTVYTYDYWADGTKTLVSQTNETQTIDSNNSKNTIGIKPMRLTIGYRHDGWGSHTGFNGGSSLGSLSPSTGAFGSWNNMELRAATSYYRANSEDNMVIEINGNQSFNTLKVIWGTYGTFYYTKDVYANGWTTYKSTQSSGGLNNWLKNQNGQTIDFKMSYN